MKSLPELLLLIHLAATLFMTGVIWFVQVIHYPLFSAWGQTEFPSCARRHAALTAWIVAPPMLVELASALLLFWLRPADVSTRNLAIGLSLLMVIWISTALLQVPCHKALQRGLDVTVHRRLVRTNWIRTVAWSLRGLLVLWMAYRSSLFGQGAVGPVAAHAAGTAHRSTSDQEAGGALE